VNPDKRFVDEFMRRDTRSPILVEVNPLARALRMTLLDATAAPGHAVLHFEPDELFLQGANVLQGGAVSAMLDFAMSFAALAALPVGQSVVSTTLEVAFLRGAKAGCYEAAGEITRLGRQIVFARASLTSMQSGAVVSTGSSTLIVIKDGRV